MFLDTSSLSAFADFRRDTTGSMAVPFALGLVTLIGGIGCAIDFGMAAKSHDRVQNVADIASLKAAQSLETDSAALNTIAVQVFEEHFGPDSPVEVAGVYRKDDAVTVQARSKVRTTFTRVFGQTEVDVSVSSTSVYAVRETDIALVLDTTESMRGARLDALKVAAGELIDEVEDLDRDAVRISVVPFAQHVNVGTSRRNKVWLDVEPDRDVTRWRAVDGSKRNCRWVTESSTRDGVPQTYSYEKCDYDWEPYQTKAKWKGCVGSRSAPLDLSAPYAGVKVPGLVDIQCGAELQELTKNTKKVRKAISGLKAQGNTYMPAGLLWGQRALSAEMPLADTSSGGAKREKVLVLMTDGDNTKSKDGLKHVGNDANDANNRTRILCDRIKDDDITVYTIAYDVKDGATRGLLQGCASSPSQYFDAKDASQLSDAFSAIADAVTQLRVSS